MHPKTVVPPAVEPNYRARELFFDHLDREWPSLKESLIERVWPAYRACWKRVKLGTEFVPRGHIRAYFVDDKFAFVAPAAVADWCRLKRSRQCGVLYKALCKWGSTVKLSQDWFLASALHTLGQFSPSQDTPGRSRGPSGHDVVNDPFEWRYHHEFDGRDWGHSFTPTFHGTEREHDGPAMWLPNKNLVKHFGTWNQFERRMLNQFKKELSRYRKSVRKRWGLNKKNHAAYARWTIARRSGLTWRNIVARYRELQNYTDPVAKAKRWVREFSVEIGLTIGS